MRLVRSDVRKRGSAACSQQTKSDNVGIQAFVDRQRDTSERIGNGAVMEGEEAVETAAPRRCSKRTPKGMRVIGRTSGRRKEKKAEWLDRGAKVKAEENDISYLPRMAVEKKFDSVKRELKKVKEDRHSLMLNSQFTQTELEQVSR